MNITVFGTGYVGLVQAAVLAEVGNNVVCIDTDGAKIERLKQGDVPIYEPGLSALIAQNLSAGRIMFTTDAAIGVDHGHIQFIAVGTPQDEDGSADLKYVLAVAETIARQMSNHKTIVNKSTVPVGTADKVKSKVAQVLSERGMTLEFDVVSNPEFLKEGSAVNDCMRPERIIVGTDSAAAEVRLKELYAPFSRNHDKMIVMNIRSAELT
ncbi:MAG: UDPglucose 6-dehydrogenase [Motiliproteus sp.]|jgi:UDPglucose 6-dehydrogenase